MLELEPALARILETIPQQSAEPVPLEEALGRYLAEEIHAPIDLPVFDNSAMDGYAVRAAEVAAATRAMPVRLRVIGKVAAGESFKGQVTAGTCVRLFTGSALPDGADAVVMQEDTRADSGKAGEIFVTEGVKPFENLRLRGEDVKRGSALAGAGELLSSGRVSLLAAMGMNQVKAGRRPAVALLATGSELREAGQALKPGQIYESNRVGLAALVRRAGGVPKVWPLVADSLAATSSALGEAFSQSDIVVTSGGVSVGELDFVKEALEKIGGELQFWRVAIKPGRPFVFGRHGERFLFGLPGNPVSALVTFLLLVRPALIRWQGGTDLALPNHSGVLVEQLSNSGDRRHFMRVKVDAAGGVCSAGLQASHALSSLATANGLVDVPPKTSLPTGTTVKVFRWD